MQQIIWPNASKNITFFSAMLLMTSVHLDGLAFQAISSTTMALKVESMRLVRATIYNPAQDAMIASISAIACLATCALVCETQHPVPAWPASLAGVSSIRECCLVLGRG